MLRHCSRVAARVVLAGTILLSVGCDVLSPESTAVFTVTGTANHVDVAYGLLRNQPIYHGATLPFTQTMRNLLPRDAVFITAQIDTDPDPGSITVTITKGGKTLYEASATGYPNIATANGPF